MSSKVGNQKGLRGTVEHAKIRVLLTLWDMGATETEVKKGELTDRITRTNERASDYKLVLDQLEESGAIAIAKNKIALTSQGVQILSKQLNHPQFEFEGNQVGVRVANALLKWIRMVGGELKVSESQVPTPAKATKAIGSYEEFKSEVLSLFQKLDKGYNYSGLVPIWHLRREVGKRVEREEFNNWMMQMQADQLFYLQSGEARGASEDQKQDSIHSDIRGLLFYASQPS